MTDDLTEQLCEEMHDRYEAAAAGAGWETNPESRKPWADVPEANKVTMRAAVAPIADEIKRLRAVVDHPIIQACIGMNGLQFPELIPPAAPTEEPDVAETPTAAEWKTHQAFHRQTVFQRDAAWYESAQQADEIKRLRAAILNHKAETIAYYGIRGPVGVDHHAPWDLELWAAVPTEGDQNDG